MHRLVIVPICLMLVTLVGLPDAALAQYYIGLAPMNARPAKAGEKLEIDLRREMMSVQDDRYKVNWVKTIFKLSVGMARWFSEEDWILDDGFYREYILQGDQHDMAGPSQFQYRFNDSPIYVCVGGYYFDGGEWKGVEEPKLITFIVNNGKPTVLDCFVADGSYWDDVVVLDVNRDGLLEMVAGFSFGASFGGGIHVVTVGSDGQMTPLGTDHEAEGQIGSANGMFAVHDYNHDGIWEIESRFGYHPAPVGASIFLRLLHEYDQQSGKWVDVTTSFPLQNAEQLAFLTQLNDHAQALLALIAKQGLDKGVDYSCLIDGELYSLLLIADERYMKDLPLLVADWQAGRHHVFHLEIP